MKKRRFPAVVVVAILLLASSTASQSKTSIKLLSPHWLQGGPDWSFGTDTTPISPPDHKHMVVSEGCDVNGDGYEDILVGRRDFSSSPPGTTHDGRVWLFLGSENGLSNTPSKILVPPFPINDGHFGVQVICAGHINNDIYDDIAVSMENYSTINYINEGAVLVFFGSASGLSVAYWSAYGGAENAHLGVSLDSAGDVNGDGYDEIIAGTELGKAYVWFGSASGLGDPGEPGNADWSASGAPEISYARTVRGIGDVNGDTFDDVMIGAYTYDGTYADEGAVFVYYGSGTGLGETGTIANADWYATGGQESAYFGYGGDGVGDLDANSADDLAIGAFSYDHPEIAEGAVFVWYGEETSGLGAPGTPANADWTAETNVIGADLGYVVRSAGDVNADGYDDLLATAYHYPLPVSLSGAGAWFVWYGSASGLGENGTPGNADLAHYCSQPLAFCGRDDAGAGDINNDGMDDIFVAAYRYDDPEEDEGVVMGWYGGFSIFLPTIFK